MPIGSTNVYNAGDLILSTVSGSGTSFTETKIVAATSSLILFNTSGTLTSQSLNSTTVGTSSYVSGSTSIITNLTASNISASNRIQANQITASSILASNGPLMVTGSNAYLQLFPVGGFSLPTNLTASYIYTSGSTNDLYFTQYNGPYTNTTRLRWLESNLYTGILHGGVLTSTPGSTTFTVTEGEGIVVAMNAFTASAPYPTIKLVKWPTSTQPIIYSGSAKITYVGIDDVGAIVQQTNAWGSSDINQWDNQIELGVVLHLSGSVSTGVFNSPQISYGIPQQTDDFLRAFGPLKISGHTLQASGSTPTLSIKKSGGTAYRDGANYVNNPNHPSTVVENAITSSKIYRYYLSGSTPIIDTGVGNAGYTTIDNDKYVNTATGQLATVGNSNWTIQRVFWIPNSPTNAFIVYYGNARYSTLLNAVNAKDSEPFTEAPNTALNGIFLGYIIIEGGAGRSLLNPDECTIIQGGLFRNVGGIGSSGTSPVSTTLAGLSDVALAGLAEGDLLVYGGGQWNNKKTLIGNYTVSGSLSVTSGITGNLTGTSSWATNAVTSSFALTASYVNGSTSIITNLTASNISASGVIIANSFTGSFSGSITNAVTAISASFSTNSLTASYLTPTNSYTVAGLSSGYVEVTGTSTIPNTGIYRPAGKTLGLSADGTLILKIDGNASPYVTSIETGNFIVPSGSVGIGTTSPSTPLHVFNTAATLATFTRDLATDVGFTIGADNSGVVLGTLGVHAIQFYTNATEKVRITSDGNVGIGITSPTVRLHVSGSSIITNPNPGANSAVLLVQDEGTATTVKDGTTLRVVNNGSAANFSVFEASSGVSDFVILNNGDVGIGTTNPLNRLSVIDSNSTSYYNRTDPVATFQGTSPSTILVSVDGNVDGYYAELKLGNAQSTYYPYSAYIRGIQGTGIDYYRLEFGTAAGSAASTRMTIANDGNVGIGTTSPTARLHVSGSIGGVFEVDTAGGATTFYVSASGNVGIGTSSPTEKLSVISGSTRIASSALAGALYLGNDTSNIYLQRDNSYDLSLVQNGDSNSSLYLASAGNVYINIDSNNNDTDKAFIIQNNALKAGTELFRIQENGNIGIGTTVPLAITDIQGTNVTLYAGNYVGSVGTIYLRGNDAYNSGTAGAGIYLRGKYDSSSNVTTFGAISAIKENNIDGNYAGALTFLSRTNGQGSGAAEKMRIDSNGNVGIGTSSPAAKLEITGSSSDVLFNIKSPISGNIIYVTGSGRVGINKSIPTATFDVSGSTIITGSLNVSTNITCLSLTETSTEAVKYNILPLPSQLENVLKLKPVSFNYKTNDKHSIGLIAEEVAKIYPEFTSETNDSISYGKLTSVLIQSIKELKNIIDNQQKQIEDLSNKLK